MAYVSESSPEHAAPIGARRLAEHWNRDSAGSLIQEFGPHPIGYIFFEQTGHFSVHIMRTPPVPPFADGPENPTLSESHELLKTYYGAFGTYSVDTAQSMIVFHVEGATRPDLIGTDVSLPFRLAGDSLVIGDEKTWRRVWVPVPMLQHAGPQEAVYPLAAAPPAKTTRAPPNSSIFPHHADQPQQRDLVECVGKASISALPIS